MPDTSFTLQETMVLHQALIASKRKLTRNRTSFVKQHGLDLYDQLIDRHRSAIGKILQLVETFRERETHVES